MLSEKSRCNHLKTEHLCILQLINFKDRFYIPAILCKHTPPLGPMPNDEIDVKNLESLEKYRSYTPYLRQAEEAKKRRVWWKTYRGYVEKADPAHGEEELGILFLRPHRTIISCLVKVKPSEYVGLCRCGTSGHWTALL